MLLIATVLTAPLIADAATPVTVALGGFSVRPAQSNPAIPATRAYFIRDVAAGGSFTSAVVVASSAAAPLTMRIYPVDGLTSQTSGAVYSSHAQPLRGAGRWLTLPHTLVTVAAHGQTTVPFTLRVPPGTPAGDHLAGIGVEALHPHRSSGRFSIIEVIRAVVAVEVRVPGPVRYHLHVGRLALQALAGTSIPAVMVTLSDDGDKLCRPRLSVALSHDGTSVGTVVRALDTILPGDTIDYPLIWPRPLTAAGYAAAVRATGCGPPQSERATIALGGTLAGTAAHPHATPARTRASSSSSTPWWIVALIAAVGVACGVAYTVLHRRGGGRGGGSR